MHQRMGFQPERARGGERLDADPGPPSDFIAGMVQLAMMAAAERHSELIADLAAARARLSKAQMVCVFGFASAQEARLSGNEPNCLDRINVGSSGFRGALTRPRLLPPYRA